MGIHGEKLQNGDMGNCTVYKNKQTEFDEDNPTVYYSWIADGFEFHIVLRGEEKPQFIISSLYGKVLDLGDVPVEVISHLKKE